MGESFPDFVDPDLPFPLASENRTHFPQEQLLTQEYAVVFSSIDV